ncbi:hypothetical protein PIB30_004924 [Stylosanthes scabra]|uniref:Uncharacterized protein n=1 Tax=Stylosanthes scabra TaxID=79078 RepID=A0ABU6W5J5_9FABA|nr:hypothetical protein [Stylosanthes scabra]
MSNMEACPSLLHRRQLLSPQHHPILRSLKGGENVFDGSMKVVLSSVLPIATPSPPLRQVVLRTCSKG